MSGVELEIAVYFDAKVQIFKITVIYGECSVHIILEISSVKATAVYYNVSVITNRKYIGFFIAIRSVEVTTVYFSVGFTIKIKISFCKVTAVYDKLSGITKYY